MNNWLSSARLAGIAVAVFAVRYLCIVGIPTSVLGVSILTNPDRFKHAISDDLMLAFYVLAIVPASIATVPAYAKQNHNPFLRELRTRSNQNLEGISTRILRTGVTFSRPEFEICNDLLYQKAPVMLTGAAGTGKSGIGLLLAIESTNEETPTLFIDARRLLHIQDDEQLRSYFKCTERMIEEVHAIGVTYGFRLIVDQLDNVIGNPIAEILIDLAIGASLIPGVEVAVLSRKRESFEARLLQRLQDSGFVEIECNLLPESEVLEELRTLGQTNPSREMVDACRNLLNFTIVAELLMDNQIFARNAGWGGLALWQKYFEILEQRESTQSSPALARAAVSEAKRLAREMLLSTRNLTQIETPTGTHRCLISWGVLEEIPGSRIGYRYSHETIQDYLYAEYAADHQITAQQVVEELGIVRSRNTLIWLEEINRTRAGRQAAFLEEILGG